MPLPARRRKPGAAAAHWQLSGVAAIPPGVVWLLDVNLFTGLAGAEPIHYQYLCK